MVNPIIKWVGGKRQLLKEITNKIPENYNSYYEPFVGGGAVFLSQFNKNHKIIINDSNIQLINVYQQIKNNPNNVIQHLKTYQNIYNQYPEQQLDFYYQQRNLFNRCLQHEELTAESASLFIFLNKTGFNGLYRVNKAGLYNVPSAHRKKINIYNEQNLLEVSEILKNVEIRKGDFEEACKDAKTGDFIFFDSPYFNTFDTYQANGFSENDHIRLVNLFSELTNRGIYCLETNSNTDFIKELYKDFDIEVVQVKRMINADASNRTGTEVIITNYALCNA